MSKQHRETKTLISKGKVVEKCPIAGTLTWELPKAIQNSEFEHKTTLLEIFCSLFHAHMEITHELAQLDADGIGPILDCLEIINRKVVASIAYIAYRRNFDEQVDLGRISWDAKEPKLASVLAEGTTDLNCFWFQESVHNLRKLLVIGFVLDELEKVATTSLMINKQIRELREVITADPLTLLGLLSEVLDIKKDIPFFEGTLRERNGH